MKKTLAGFSSYFQSIRLILTPLVLAAPAVIIWHYLYLSGWHSTSQADEPIVNAILPGLFGAHVFIAGFMIIRESDDIRKLKHAVREGDKATFIEIAEDSIPVPMRYILFTTAKSHSGLDDQPLLRALLDRLRFSFFCRLYPWSYLGDHR